MDKLINIHTHKIHDNCIQIYNAKLDRVWPREVLLSFGLHPWDIAKLNIEEWIKIIEKKCKNKLLIAIGEIGIDRVIETPIDFQKEVFCKQLELANKYNLPVIIHSVKANSDILEIHKSFNNKTTWIIHGYLGSIESVNQFIKRGVYLSFGESILLNKKSQKALQETPVNKLFFETDDSNISIETIYKKAAELLHICTHELKTQIRENFNFVFG